MAGRRRRAQWLILVLLFGTLQAWAGGNPPPSQQQVENPTPSADLLMFLADFDDSDGEVIDRAETAVAEQRAQPAETAHDDDE